MVAKIVDSDDAAIELASASDSECDCRTIALTRCARACTSSGDSDTVFRVAPDTDDLESQKKRAELLTAEYLLRESNPQRPTSIVPGAPVIMAVAYECNWRTIALTRCACACTSSGDSDAASGKATR